MKMPPEMVALNAAVVLRVKKTRTEVTQMLPGEDEIQIPMTLLNPN